MLAKLVCVHDRRWHQLRCLVAGEPEHQTLIAGALFRSSLAGGRLGVHALGDVRALGGEVVVDEHLVRMKNIVAIDVANPSDGIAHDLFDVELGLGRDLAADADDVALDEGLAGDAASFVLREAGVEHGIGDRV